jgi:hypothetical protein
LSRHHLKIAGLKIAVVFNYEAFRFEAWIAATNRQVQRKYWELFRNNRWAKYRVVTPAKGVDSIIECDLAEEGFDFGDLHGLTANIEERTAHFIDEIERFLLDHGGDMKDLLWRIESSIGPCTLGFARFVLSP